MDKSEIFKRLRNGEIIPSSDSQRKELRDASYSTKKLLVQMNNSSDPNEIRGLLGQITNTELDESVAVFTPLYINYGGITIDDNVLIAPKVSLLSEGHPVSPIERHSIVPKPIHIKKNAWIGANATILQGVTIGENSVVAAGSVVSRNVPDNVIVGGTPAKIIKSIE